MLVGRPLKLSADPKLHQPFLLHDLPIIGENNPTRRVVGRASVLIILRTCQRMYKNDRVSPVSVENYLINIRACHVPAISVFNIFHFRAEGW